MSDSLFIQNSTKAVKLSALAKGTFKTLDKDQEIPIRINKRGIIFPYDYVNDTNEKTFEYNISRNRTEAKSLKEQIDEAIEFFDFLSLREEDNLYLLGGNVMSNTGQSYQFLIKIEDDFPSTPPSAFYKSHYVESTRFFYNSWRNSYIIDFIADAIICINKSECHSLLGYWPGSKITSTKTEVL